ncbi:hypothetical protein MN116_000135 [Schistosoma mekongi]|uniref:Uncharacterized protein n=1 Tax=Schistosoma mekongi TaxID=38744 RepID=A0AAE1Z7X0_SCHME|nr:hypothetical protein MN116_000135 [Schistosoma mekongi]
MDRMLSRTSLSKSRNHDNDFTSLALTYRIQNNLNKLKSQLDLHLDDNSELHNEEISDLSSSESKPFVLKFIEHENKKHRNQDLEKIDNTTTNTMQELNKSPVQKKRKLLPDLQQTEYSLAIVPKTGTVSKIPIEDQKNGKFHKKSIMNSSKNHSVNNEDIFTTIRIQFDNEHINDQLKIISYISNEQMKTEAKYSGSNFNGLTVSEN